MRRAILALVSALALSGCLSTLDSMYDDQSRRQCEESTRPSERGECLDRVDRHRQERRD